MLDVAALGELLIDFTCLSTDENGYPTMAAHPGGAPANFLAALANVPEGERGAQFHCAIVAISADGRRFDAEGIVRGEILRAARGENGFGYDPLFYVREFDKTTAELSMDEKNAISHRGQAVRKIVAILKENVFLR